MNSSPPITLGPKADPARLLARLWRDGPRPDASAFLEGCEGLRPSEVAAVLRVDQRERWGLGERVPAGDYLRDFPALRGDPEAALELIYAEFLIREERGEAPTAEEYARLYPDHAARLALQIQLHRAFGDLDGGMMDTSDEVTGPPRWPEVAGYEVLGELGRGGMGVVYKARQVRLDRVVALKMILAGEHASPAALARFGAEARSIARLQHPGIVQVFEVGEDDGRPYLALEYVEGGTLAQRLAGTPMRPESSAEMVESLARAVHEAHRKGIVHRDMKPANVLLTPDGSPKVADFGLAKGWGGEAGLTEPGHAQGTPRYMAPEQVAGRSAEIGPAADVWALGVLLYEMLTGHPPFQAASAHEVMEQVRSADPVPPRRLLPRLPRDLETIGLKCLHKDPRRRYASAEALADDLRRFMDGRPILARPVGRVERAARWCLREPRVAGLLAALAVVFVVGFALVAWQWRRAEHEADVARGRTDLALKEQARAERNFGRAREAVHRLTAIAEGFLERPRMQKEARAVLEPLLAYHRAFLGEKGDDPAIRREAASAWFRVGHIRGVLGRAEEAEQAYRRGVELLEALAKLSPGDASVRRDLARGYKMRGMLLREAGRDAEALAEHDRSVALGEALVNGSPSDADLRADLANALLNRIVVFKRLGLAPRVEADFGRAIDLLERALAASPRSSSYREGLALGLDDLGLWLWEQGRAAEAERAGRRALDLRRDLLDEGERPRDLPLYLARSHARIGRIEAATARPREAEASFRAALDHMAAVAEGSPDAPLVRDQLARYEADLAAILDAQGRHVEAEALQRSAIAHYRKLTDDFPDRPAYRKNQAHRLRLLSQALSDAGRHADATAELRRALDLLPDDAPLNNAMAWMFATCPDPAHRNPARAVEHARKAVAARPPDGNYWNTLGAALHRAGDDRGAIDALRRSMDLRSGGDALDWLFLAMAHQRLGHDAEARRWLDRAVPWISEHKPEDRELARLRAEAEVVVNGPRADAPGCGAAPLPPAVTAPSATP